METLRYLLRDTLTGPPASFPRMARLRPVLGKQYLSNLRTDITGAGAHMALLT